MAAEKNDFNTVLEDVKNHVDSHIEHDEARSEQSAPSDDELRVVRRKIDWRLMPIMVGTYGLQFYGKWLLGML